ncbi:hypothetical protein ABZ807_17485 [Micromonospora sp. NPDC047548]|uniref:hypothetical protein n=1 Tax=Micromonospora sp. NPDC047548 TaxID=3155624 RepID=UPI0033FE5AFF
MRKISRALATGVFAFTLVGVGAGVAVAGSNTVQACTLRADVPDSDNNAWVGREGCSNTVPGTGYIYEDRNNWPDDEVGKKSFDAGTALVDGSCGNGKGNYYSKFKSSTGASAESSRAERC